MKTAITYTVFVLTCLYFLSAGNLSLFSKLGKYTQTEICDLDEDAADAEGKEAKDSKEDGSSEEVFMEILSAAMLPSGNLIEEINFHDPHFFISQNSIEKIAPPPRA